MSLDTITFVKGALFSLLGNRLRLKDSQPLATHPRPLASTRLDSRIRTTLRASTLITASGGSPSPRRTRASCRDRNLSSPPPLSESVCLPRAAGKPSIGIQGWGSDSSRARRSFARPRRPPPHFLVLSQVSQVRRSSPGTHTIVHINAPACERKLPEKHSFARRETSAAKHIVNNMKRIVFLRNRVVPARAGKDGTFRRLKPCGSACWTRDGARVHPRRTHAQKTHPRSFHKPKIPVSCHIRYSSRRIDRTRVAQLLKRPF